MHTLIPEPTLRRLPKYHHFLVGLREQGVTSVSCTRIGDSLGLLPVQVRKDLQYTGIVGRPKVGYELQELLDKIEQFLGWDNTNDAFLVGAGHLGSALLGYTKFEQFGLSIVAAFDADARKVGTQIHGKHVLPLEKVAPLAQRMGVHIGIITTPAESAQRVADLLVAGGVRAIWNFAPVTLNLPANIIVQNEDLYNSLAALSCKLARNLHSSRRTHGDGYDERPEIREGMRNSGAEPEAACAVGSNIAGDTR
ncbi:MAG TPA: redox-sensing transcriptional repressor Rex [Candidatus Acidoferrales bacterium]|nr:redox-sensing transcriptional repressor Rex [Candidatus Acidoferrales bacterium]